MRSVRNTGVLLLVFFFCFSSLALAEVVRGTAKTIKLETTPVDMAVSADGKYTFVLAEGGSVFIFNGAGQLQDTLKVSAAAVSIGTSPAGDYLYLADSKAKTLEMVQISFVVDIDTSGLPFKGPANAPVVIAVFSDYQ